MTTRNKVIIGVIIILAVLLVIIYAVATRGGDDGGEVVGGTKVAESVTTAPEVTGAVFADSTRATEYEPIVVSGGSSETATEAPVAIPSEGGGNSTKRTIVTAAPLTDPNGNQLSNIPGVDYVLVEEATEEDFPYRLDALILEYNGRETGGASMTTLQYLQRQGLFKDYISIKAVPSLGLTGRSLNELYGILEEGNGTTAYITFPAVANKEELFAIVEKVKSVRTVRDTDYVIRNVFFVTYDFVIENEYDLKNTEAPVETTGGVT
jgi:hypothetical protein